MINLSKKIVVFALDGALTESKQKLENDMSHLLCSLAQEKIVAIITGGSYEQFKKQFLPFLKPNEENKNLVYKNLILLSTSGSQRYQYDIETKDWIMVDVKSFPDKIKNKILFTLNDLISSNNYGIIPAIEGDDIIEDRLTQITMSALGQHAPLELKKKWDPDQKKRQEIKKILEVRLPEVNIFIGGTTSIDIIPKGFDEAKGIKRLLNKLEMSTKDVVFVGNAIYPGGGDYSVYEAGIESIKVSDPLETKEIIKKWLE
jgi:HAD superfamily hydrolase (TIGR01484 family)